MIDQREALAVTKVSCRCVYINSFICERIRVSERFDKTIVSAWKIAVSMILCNGRPAWSSCSYYGLSDTVYLVRPTGIRTVKPWVSKQQPCIFTSKLSGTWVKGKGWTSTCYPFPFFFMILLLFWAQDGNFLVWQIIYHHNCFCPMDLKIIKCWFYF